MHKEPDKQEVSAAIAALPAMNKTQLMKVWEQTFSAQPPPKLRKELMVPLLAYRMQESAYGGLSLATRARLRQLVLQRPTVSARVSNPAPTNVPTAKLIRSWRGEVHEVLITGEGYVYRGELFQKLSPIAKRITGTQWSGPAFFGTKQKGKAQ